MIDFDCGGCRHPRCLMCSGCSGDPNLHKPPFMMTEPFTDTMKAKIRERINETVLRFDNPACDKTSLKWEINQLTELLSAGSYRGYYNKSWIFEDVLPQLEGPQGRKIFVTVADEKSLV